MSSPSRNTLNDSQKGTDVSICVTDSPLAQSARNDSQANGQRDQPPSSVTPKDLQGFFAPHDPNNVELMASVDRRKASEQAEMEERRAKAQKRA